jgi:hypothetical protein
VTSRRPKRADPKEFAMRSQQVSVHREWGRTALYRFAKIEAIGCQKEAGPALWARYRRLPAIGVLVREDAAKSVDDIMIAAIHHVAIGRLEFHSFAGSP